MRRIIQMGIRSSKSNVIHKPIIKNRIILNSSFCNTKSATMGERGDSVGTPKVCLY